MRLSILQYGAPILRAKGKHVEKIDQRIRELAQNMIETMHAANGVGLAAPQIGESLQLTVLDVSQVEDRPKWHSRRDWRIRAPNRTRSRSIRSTARCQ